MLTLFSFFFFCFLFGFSSYLFSSGIFFLRLGVWDSKLANPNLNNQPQLWPVLPPVPIEKTLTGHISTMSKEFKKDSK